MIYRRLRLHTLLAGALLLLGAAPASAFVCLNIGRCVTWPSKNAHMKIFLARGFDDDAILAAEEWNGIGTQFQFSWEVGGTFNDPCGAQGPAHICDNTGPADDNPVFFTNSACGRGFGDILAQTNNCYDTRTAAMVNAPVYVNGTNNWDAYDGPLTARYDIRRVLAHELGHVLGLVHPDDNGQTVRALMNRQISDIDRPQTDDTNGIATLYFKNTGSGGSGSGNTGCSIAAGGASGDGWLFAIGLLLLSALGVGQHFSAWRADSVCWERRARGGGHP